MLARLKESFSSRLFGNPSPTEEELAAAVRIQWKDIRFLFRSFLIFCLCLPLPMLLTTGAAIVCWPAFVDRPWIGNERVPMKAISIGLILSGAAIGLLVTHWIERKTNPAQTFRQTLRQLFFLRTFKDILAELRNPKGR